MERRSAELAGVKAQLLPLLGRADLYPSIRIGAQLGFESYLGSALPEWARRVWSIGPRLDLPIFDRGRRKAVVQLRELQQQEAAIAYQRTILQAWREIDAALAAYAAERLQERELDARATRAWPGSWCKPITGRAPSTSPRFSTASGPTCSRGANWWPARGGCRQGFVAVNRAVGN